MANRSAPALIALENANLAASRMREEAVSVVLLIGEDGEEDEIQEELEESEENLAALGTALQQYADFSLLESADQNAVLLQVMGQEMYTIGQAMIAARSADDPDMDAYKKDLELAEEDFIKLVNAVISEETVRFDQDVRRSEDAVSLVGNMFWLAIGFVTVFGTLVIYLFSRQVIIPLVTMKETAVRLGQGDFAERITVNSQDEIGVLGQQFNIMAANLQQQIEESRQLAQVAQKGNEFKTNLIARVSHELRSPLGAVLGVSEMLLDGGMSEPLSSDQAALMQRVVRNTNDLTVMVNTLLEQSRLNSSHLSINERPFAPRDIIQHVLATHEVIAQTKSLTLQAEIDESLPATLYGDPDKVGQVVSNLVHNAVKFTEAGSVTVRATMPAADIWTLAIQDTGIGIPPEAQSLIFEEFRQIDESVTRTYGGLGLGLSIVNEVVQAIGGKIALDSTVGEGSTFSVTLPLKSIEDGSAHEQQVVSVNH